MIIRMDKAIAEFIPENARETAELEALWVRMGNCVGDNKTLAPLGTYEPKGEGENIARFHIGGLTEVERNAVPEFTAPYDTDVYCKTCNKTIHVKAGEQIPLCCGRLMEVLD